jgi:quercetin dioxygenase-like cupin family protein
MKNLRRMLLPFLFTTVTLFFIAETSRAQDVLKVAGGKETHKVLVDNNSVRVLDVRLQPGQKIAMHSHPANVVYYQTDAKLKITFADGKTADRDVKAGQALWNDPVTHAVENVGSSEVHLVQVELKSAAASGKK